MSDTQFIQWDKQPDLNLAHGDPGRIVGLCVFGKGAVGWLRGWRRLSILLLVAVIIAIIALASQPEHETEYYRPYLLFSLTVGVMDSVALILLFRAIRRIGNVYPARGLMSDVNSSPRYGTFQLAADRGTVNGCTTVNALEVPLQKDIEVRIHCESFAGSYCINAISVDTPTESGGSRIVDLSYDPTNRFSSDVDIVTIFNGTASSTQTDAERLVHAVKNICSVIRSTFPQCAVSGTFTYTVTKAQLDTNALLFGILGAAASLITDAVRTHSAKRNFIDGALPGIGSKSFSEVLEEEALKIEVVA